jgi:hypothetical protein
MESTFKIWKTSRKFYLNFFSEYNLDQLNTTPAGFNNNLIWHIGHVIIAQQGLVYKLSGLPCYVTDELYTRYSPGTKPTQAVTQQQADELKELLLSLIEKTESDFLAGKFKTFSERTTATGFHVGSITDAIEFVNYHEGLHLGHMRALAKFI